MEPRARDLRTGREQVEAALGEHSGRETKESTETGGRGGRPDEIFVSSFTWLEM